MDTIKIKRLSDKATLPEYMTKDSAGFDFYASEDFEILPFETKAVGTSLSMSIPEGFYMSIVPRSGLSLRTNLFIKNAPGTIDADYRGEIKIIIYNSGKETYYGKSKDRIAQGILQKYEKATFEIVSELENTDRGSGGFGHTGA